MIRVADLRMPAESMARPGQEERLAMGGGREIRVGDSVVYQPSIAERHYRAVQFGSLPPVEAPDSLFDGFLKRGTAAWDNYFRTRKVVERPLQAGGTEYCVAPNIADLSVSAGDVLAQPREKGKPREYKLAQLFTDSYLFDKFDFSPQQWARFRGQAVADPVAAAAAMQKAVRMVPGNETARVVAGDYSRTKGWAKGSIGAYGQNFRQLMAASDSALIGEDLLIYGPPSPVRWFVSGSVKYASEVAEVHKMVAVAGTASVMFALGTELTILGINICNGLTYESPSVTHHVGEHVGDASPSVDTSSLLTAEGQVMLHESAAMLEELTDDNGVGIATAVRLSGRMVLVNSHVAETCSAGGMYIRGKRIYTSNAVSKDLWIASHDGEDAGWQMRSPVVGEQVAILYKWAGGFSYSPPLSLRACDGQALIMSKSDQLVPGMSGGAVVSIADFALLGIYEGVGSSNALGAVITPEGFMDACTVQVASESGHAEALTGGTVYDKMRGKGLGKLVDAAISSMSPVYAGGVHVGSAYQSFGLWRTTCGLVMPLSLGERDNRVEFKPEGVGSFFNVYRESGIHGPGPLVVRDAVYGEKVFVVGVDDSGPYCSPVSAPVVHVGLSAKNFLVEVSAAGRGLPLVGGLVLAAVDGAVLGQFVSPRASTVYGECGFCVALVRAEKVETGESLALRASKVFPLLHFGVWPEGALEEAVTHSSAGAPESGRGQVSLAFLGDSVMRTLLGMTLREAGQPSSTWQCALQERQSNAACAAVAEKIGLDRLVVTGLGTALPKGCKAHADVLEAVVGAAYLYESEAVVRRLCEGLGLLFAG